MVALTAPVRLTLKVSLASVIVSSLIATVIVLVVSPAAKFSVPEVAV